VIGERRRRAGNAERPTLNGKKGYETTDNKTTKPWTPIAEKLKAKKRIGFSSQPAVKCHRNKLLARSEVPL